MSGIYGSSAEDRYYEKLLDDFTDREYPEEEEDEDWDEEDDKVLSY